MTTHEGHDHPNTKAGRAACRRAALQGQPPKTTEEASRERHPAGKKLSPDDCDHPNVKRQAHKNQHSQDIKYHYRCPSCGKTSVSPFGAAAKARKRKADTADPSMPHAYDEDMEKANRCYICKRGASASVHTEGPRDLAKLLTFGARR